MEPALSAREIALREKFLDYYMVDFDAVRACVCIGFIPQLAQKYAMEFESCPYVLKRVHELRTRTPAKPKVQDEQDKQLVRTALRQALMNGPYASRVAAAAKMASILGMDAPTKQEVTHRGGVMMVPGIAKLDDWESAASASQEKLVAETQGL